MIGAIFTAVSIVRSYSLRRVFELIKAPQTGHAGTGF